MDFFLNAHVLPAREGRFLASGAFDNASIIAVVFRPLGSEAPSIISMCSANRRERAGSMTRKWPSFVTADLGDTDAGEAEMERRWQVYDREMKALIAAGGVHQDEDGWWVDDATGELIGPGPEIERPLTDAELANMRPFAEVFPDLAESIKRSRGRPALENPKKQVTLRLDANVFDKLRASGPGWQSRVNDMLKKAVGLYVAFPTPETTP